MKLNLFAALGTIVISSLNCAMDAPAQSPPENASSLTSGFYVEPTFFVGTLYLSTATQLSQRQAEFLSSEIEKARSAGQLLALGSSGSVGSSKTFSHLKSLKWSADPTIVELNELTPKTFELIASLRSGSCIWLQDSELGGLTSEQRQKLGQHLASCLANRVVVIVDASSNDDSTANATEVAVGLNLLPDIQLLRRRHSEEKIAANVDAETKVSVQYAPNDKLQLRIGEEAWIRVCQRQLANLSEPDTLTCELRWPATATYTEVLREPIASRTIYDLTAGRRALYERRMPVFPTSTPVAPRMTKGSLVIVGGGGDSKEIWQKFLDLAGGSEAKIVVLPTAMPQPELEEADEAQLLKRLGAKEVRVLPQHSRDDVSTEEYLANLRWATGVWFGGGRQWRFVDAYYGTPAWYELQQVVARGGVIAGSSAGATIQGDLLVRGHPLGNQIMVADGYRRGLGLLPGVAIDQHFKQRNRFDELASVLERFPSVFGIGIDESTALVVESPNHCSVLGKGSVWINPPGQSGSKRTYTQHASGSQFDLP